jgi:MOSC domain-containing protein YiiM
MVETFHLLALILGTVSSVAYIFLAEKRGAPMRPTTSVEAISDCGLRGDRYVVESVRPSPDYQVTLIELENIEAFTKRTGLLLTPEMPRRNIVTTGVRLNPLLGKRFFAGSALLEGLELCEPCRLFAKRTYPGVLEFFPGKGGLRARILSGGIINTGDRVALSCDEATNYVAQA